MKCIGKEDFLEDVCAPTGGTDLILLTAPCFALKTTKPGVRVCHIPWN